MHLKCWPVSYATYLCRISRAINPIFLAKTDSFNHVIPRQEDFGVQSQQEANVCVFFL